MEQSTLEHIASHLGLGLLAGASSFAVIWTLVKGVNKDMTDVEALQRCRKRVASWDMATWWSKELVECDEAYDVLEMSDKHNFQNEQNKGRGAALAKESFQARIPREGLSRQERAEEEKGDKTKKQKPRSQSTYTQSDCHIGQNMNYQRSQLAVASRRSHMCGEMCAMAHGKATTTHMLGLAAPGASGASEAPSSKSCVLSGSTTCLTRA